MPKTKLFYFFLLLTLLPFLGSAINYNSDFLSLEEKVPENLIKEISYIKDNSFDIHTISEQNFIPLNNSKIGSKNGFYWFKIILKTNQSTENLMFNCKESTVNHIEIYNKFKLIANSHNNLGFTNFSLKIKQQANNTYYLKVNFPYQANFPLTVYPLLKQHRIQTINLFKIGWYYGFVFMVFIINMFFYFSLKDRTFFYYSLFLIATNFGISHYDGIYNLWLNFDVLFYTNNISHFIIPVTGAIFATSFLNLNIYLPKSKFYGTILLFITFICYAVHLTTRNYSYFIAADILALITLMYYWGLGVSVLRHNDFAKFFVIGYSLVLISAFFFVIPMDFGISTLSVSLGHVKFGALFEMLILTYAITYRVKKLQEENDMFRSSIQTYVNQLYELQEKIELETNSKENTFESKIVEIASKHQLTDREVDVLLNLSKGYTNQKIADELFISLNTVKYHTRNIYQKLNIKNKNEAISLFV